MPATPSTASLQVFSRTLSGLVAKAAPGIVAIHSHRSRASGFVWRPGLIVTAHEALAEEGEITVALPDGETLPVTLAGRDPTTDVALLRVDRMDLQPVSLAAEPVAAGSIAIVVGAQEGAPTAAFGVVSLSGSEWRSLRGGEIDARIELDLSLRRSAEGGLVLDPGGQAFGMAVFGPRRRVLVIPSATIDRVAARLETHGRIPRGYLGLALQTVRIEEAGVGAMVLGVEAGGPGAAAGVRQGDVILAWNGNPIRSVRTLLKALGPDSVTTIVRLSLKRAGEPVELSLTVGERPEA
jgi:S1-C subfamily serine protease